MRFLLKQQPHSRHVPASPPNPAPPPRHTPALAQPGAPQPSQGACRCRCSAAEQPPEGAAAGSPAEGPATQQGQPQPLGAQQGLDQNQLNTALDQAIAANDFGRAAVLRDQLQAALGQSGQPFQRDWRVLGVPDWLAERAERLGYRFPTEVQRRAGNVLREGSDAILRSETGSGKTLAFLLPLLARLDYPPYTFPEDLKGPQLVVIVPTRELGVQIALLTYKLFGGSTSAGLPGNPDNMFAYSGPRHLKVRGVLDKEEVLAAKHRGALAGVHVVVATPGALEEVLHEPSAVPALSHTRALVFDEADTTFSEEGVAVRSILEGACLGRGGERPQVVLAGATSSPDETFLAAAIQEGWVRDPVTVQVGEPGRVPRGIRHRFLVVPRERALLTLCRQLRDDLQLQGEDLPAPRVMVFAETEGGARDAARPLRSALWGDHSVSVLLPETGEEPIKALLSFRDNRTSFLLATPAAARGLDLPAVSCVYNLGLPQGARDYLHRAGRAGRIGNPVPGVVTTIIEEGEVVALQRIALQLELDILPLELPLSGLLPPGPPAASSDAAPGGEGLVGAAGARELEERRKGLEDLFNLL